MGTMSKVAALPLEYVSLVESPIPGPARPKYPSSLQGKSSHGARIWTYHIQNSALFC